MPTVFSYFPSRDELVRAVLLDVDRFLNELIARVALAESSASQALLAIIRAFADCVESHPDYIKVWLNWSTSIQEGIWPLYEDFQRRVIEAFVEIIHKGNQAGSSPLILIPNQPRFSSLVQAT